MATSGAEEGETPRTAEVENVIVAKDGSQKLIRPGSEEWVIALNELGRYGSDPKDAEEVTNLSKSLSEFNYAHSL